MMRMASHSFSGPKAMEASAPPVTAQETAPERTIWKAIPIACVADAQALATVKVGPVKPKCMEIWLLAALTISRGIASGGMRRAPSW